MAFTYILCPWEVPCSFHPGLSSVHPPGSLSDPHSHGKCSPNKNLGSPWCITRHLHTFYRCLSLGPCGQGRLGHGAAVKKPQTVVAQHNKDLFLTDDTWPTWTSAQKSAEARRAATTINVVGDQARGQRSGEAALPGVAQWLSASLQMKGSLVRFPVRVHARVVGQVPSRGHARGNHTWMVPSLSPFLSL